ncbi:hypothetical protein SUGI_0132560 [Cryptomeria japonica]|nr:hypothetical protein SUGI_0132560 [Cryptomeria japonica]
MENNSEGEPSILDKTEAVDKAKTKGMKKSFKEVVAQLLPTIAEGARFVSVEPLAVGDYGNSSGEGVEKPQKGAHNSLSASKNHLPLSASTPLMDKLDSLSKNVKNAMSGANKMLHEFDKNANFGKFNEAPPPHSAIAEALEQMDKDQQEGFQMVGKNPRKRRKNVQQLALEKIRAANPNRRRDRNSSESSKGGSSSGAIIKPVAHKDSTDMDVSYEISPSSDPVLAKGAPPLTNFTIASSIALPPKKFVEIADNCVIEVIVANPNRGDPNPSEPSADGFDAIGNSDSLNTYGPCTGDEVASSQPGPNKD